MTAVTLEHTWPAWGLDEAGRGPILGPMTLALVCLDAPAADHLRGLGVQDSKRFGSGTNAQELRASLAAEIRRVSLLCACALIPVDTIDEHTFRGQLNHLEQRTALQLLVAAKKSALAAGVSFGFKPGARSDALDRAAESAGFVSGSDAPEELLWREAGHG